MAHCQEKLLKLVLIPAFMLSLFPGHASGSIVRFAEFAQSCGLTTSGHSARVFSDNDKNHWKEYPTSKVIPEDGEWSEAAYMWGRVGSSVAVDVEGNGQDFAESVYYCFDAGGKLSSLEHEFRTAWDWGFTERREFGKDGKETSSSHFFNMTNRNTVPRPLGADDVREAMTVKIYKVLSEVPFFHLLGQARVGPAKSD